MGEHSKRTRQRSRESASSHGKSSSRTLDVKRPKLTTAVPAVEVIQQQPTPESPTGWSGMKDFLLTELRREMGLPLHRPRYKENVDEKSVNLACPLFIKNPAAFTHVRNSCTDGNIKGGIGKLIEHIKRVHLRSDKQCHNCGSRLKPTESKSSHARSCTKMWSPHEPPLLTEEQQRVLEGLSVRASGQSLEYKYRHKLLMKLFPGQEDWASRVDIYHDAYSPCLLPTQLMFEAMEKAVDKWERGYATHMYDSDGSDADSDQSPEYRRASGSSPSAASSSSSTDASSAYPSGSSGGYGRSFGNGTGYGAQYSYQLPDYQGHGLHADMDDMSLATASFEHAQQTSSGVGAASGKSRNRSRPAAADVDYAAAAAAALQMQSGGQTYGSHAGTLEDFEGSSSYADLEPVFDVVSTVPSDYHSYTMDVEHFSPSDYLGHGYYPKDTTINPKDLIGLGSAPVPRYLFESEEDTSIVLQDTQEYLGGTTSHSRRSHR